MAQKGYLDLETCPVCKKTFVKAPKNIYKLIINGKTVHYDRYSCYTKAKGEKNGGKADGNYAY